MSKTKSAARTVTMATSRPRRESRVQSNAQGYSISGDLAVRVKDAALRAGMSPDEIVVQALREFVAKSERKAVAK